jgi:6-pyruvoyltetrahydropterin/6-carboxytetrahydropterin synthase
MPLITRRLEFDAGHRILGHEGKCRNPHGHRYVAEISVWSQSLDPLGRVVDFSVIKEEVGGWIEKNWDHTMILSRHDPLLKCPEIEKADKPPYIILPKPPRPESPTAEVLAEILYDVSKQLLPPHLEVRKVVLYETPNCRAEYPDQ